MKKYGGFPLMVPSVMAEANRYYYKHNHTVAETLIAYKQYGPEQVKDALRLYDLKDEPEVYCSPVFRQQWDELREAFGII